MGYTQKCDIWHIASLGTLIMIQEATIWKTMWGPCFGHKRAIFRPFLGKGDYGIHPELWNLAWSIPGHIDYNSGRTIWRPIWGQCFGHKRAIFCPFLEKRGLRDTPRIVKFGMEQPWAQWLWFRKSQFEGPGEYHVWAIKGSYFGHFWDYWFTEW